MDIVQYIHVYTGCQDPPYLIEQNKDHDNTTDRPYQDNNDKIRCNKYKSSLSLCLAETRPTGHKI